MKDKVIAIIPARGGSKRLPRKNIYPYFGRPLLQWVIEACQQSKYIAAIYVSTEDGEIKKLALQLGVKVIDRPRELAADNVWTQEVLKHAVSQLEKRGEKIEIVARIQANSPQIKAAKIDEAIAKLIKHDRWEIFSVDQNGLEDAAIHVMRRQVVWQEALSVYKGIIQTDYIDVHTASDVANLESLRIKEIEEKSHAFLRQLHDESLQRTWRALVPKALAMPILNLWLWQTRVPLYHRWQLVLQGSPALQAFLTQPDCYNKAQAMRILDLGSGFGMYWPILREYGFRKFVGVDLFDLRQRQLYLQGARRYIARFCADCETQIIMDDVRNLARHKLLFDKFDLILNIATTATKAGSTGIPYKLFQEIVRQYGSNGYLPVHVEKAH